MRTKLLPSVSVTHHTKTYGRRYHVDGEHRHLVADLVEEVSRTYDLRRSAILRLPWLPTLVPGKVRDDLWTPFQTTHDPHSFTYPTPPRFDDRANRRS